MNIQKNIKKIIIYPFEIEYTEKFWSKNSLGTFYFRVNPNCEFPSFINECEDITHIWIELPNLRKLPENVILNISGIKSVKLFVDSEIDEDIDEYLMKKKVDYFIIKVNKECSIPNSLKNLVI